MTSQTAEYSTTSKQVFNVAQKAPMLQKKHEHRLAKRWQKNKDAAALSELTQSYLRLAIAVAKKYKNYGLPQADLIQEGTVGLLIAAEKFETERDLRFSTYATWWIRATIQDYVLRNWSIVRTGTTSAHKKLFFSLRQTRAKLVKVTDETLKPESISKIANEMNVREVDVITMEKRLFASDQSLNKPIGDESQAEWQDLLVDNTENPEEFTQSRHDGEVRSQLLENALKTLSPRELQIIQKRKLADNEQTLAEIGENIGVSKERVRQLEVQALDKLKRAIMSQLRHQPEMDYSLLF